jgi:uncharacterized membrane protein
MEYNNVIKYTYTESELRKVNNNVAEVISSILISLIPIILSFSLIYDIKTLDNSSVIFIAALIILTVTVSIYGFIMYAKNTTKFNSYLKAEQKIYFKNNILYYESGDYTFYVETKYISKIRQTKNFYRIDILLEKGGHAYIGGSQILILPQIPRRAILRMEMKHIASLLNIDYKDSLFWK